MLLPWHWERLLRTALCSHIEYFESFRAVKYEEYGMLDDSFGLWRCLKIAWPTKTFGGGQS